MSLIVLLVNVNLSKLVQKIYVGMALCEILKTIANVNHAPSYQDVSQTTISMMLLAIASLSRFAHKIYAGTAPHVIL